MQDRWNDEMGNQGPEENFSLDDIIKEVREMSRREQKDERPIVIPPEEPSPSREEKREVSSLSPKEEAPSKQQEKIPQETVSPAHLKPSVPKGNDVPTQQRTESIDNAPTQKVGPIHGGKRQSNSSERKSQPRKSRQNPSNSRLSPKNRMILRISPITIKRLSLEKNSNIRR